MGKMRALELLVVFACSLCWGSAIHAQATLRVGAARVDITPPSSEMKTAILASPVHKNPPEANRDQPAYR